jgi:hypothetical protein
MRRTLSIFFIFLLPAFAIFSHAQYTWKLVKDEAGIKVYQGEAKNATVKPIKVECTLPGNYDKLIAVLNDVNHHVDWVYNNKTAYILKRISNYEFYYYTETYLPWPMSNRDAIMHLKMTKDSLNRFLKITAVGIPEYIPQKSGKVRVPRTSISWYVTMPSKNSIHISYIFDANPGGNLPSWLVNMFADKGPYESFKKLGEILKKP